MKSLFAIASMCALAGCASVVNDSTQPIKLETRASNGAAIEGAECKLSNDYGSTTVKSGATHQVRRSSKDLDITCTQPEQGTASARAISRGNAGLAGNIILGGGIGMIIDHNKGTAYTYPTWMQLVFGQTLVFDRRDEKEGAPVLGRTPEAAALAAQTSTLSTPAGGATSSACSQGVPPCPPLR